MEYPKYIKNYFHKPMEKTAWRCLDAIRWKMREVYNAFSNENFNKQKGKCKQIKDPDLSVVLKTHLGDSRLLVWQTTIL